MQEKKLERIQEGALRIVFADRTATYQELLDNASLPSLVNKRLQDILILMYKVKYFLAPEHICDIFCKQGKHYNLRCNFSIPRYGTVKYGKHSTRYLGPYLWGKINQDIHGKTSLRAFVGTTQS